MAVGNLLMRAFKLVFREQKTRLQIDWLTHTDEQIMQRLANEDAEPPDEIAIALDRSQEYVADRCRQLAIRGLLDEIDTGPSNEPAYRLGELGRQYLSGEIRAEELEDLGSRPSDQ